MRAPVVEKRLLTILQVASVATSLPLDLEDGRRARNVRDAVTIRARKAEVITDLPITSAVTTRARDIQLALTHRGHHRAVSWTVPDHRVSAAAEHGAIVVHHDRDFDLIADIGGPRRE